MSKNHKKNRIEEPNKKKKEMFNKTVLNWLACIYTVHQGNPYKMGLFRE